MSCISDGGRFGIVVERKRYTSVARSCFSGRRTTSTWTEATLYDYEQPMGQRTIGVYKSVREAKAAANRVAQGV